MADRYVISAEYGALVEGYRRADEGLRRSLLASPRVETQEQREWLAERNEWRVCMDRCPMFVEAQLSCMDRCPMFGETQHG